MNCKQGDLAVIVSTLGSRRLDRCIGWVVKVVRLSGVDEFGPKWEVEHPEAERVADACLRPIRPGDVTDEEVRDLYSPKQLEPA